MNVLITGITGSGGSYLAEYILENHPEVSVHGICRWHSTSVLTNIEGIRDKITLHECDLLDVSSIIRVLDDVKPERIFHLAAYANVKKCFDTPLSVVNNNVMGTANLLEAIRLSCPDAIVQMCSTSEVYGATLADIITEEHPLEPVNPYAVSKLAQEKLAYAYHKSWGLRVVITRAFAYFNPRRYDLFATAFALQVARIEQGKQDILKHGNLESIRTLIDVRDMMRAYWVACEKCELGVSYNVGGKDVMSVGKYLDILKSKANVNIISKQDNNLLRPIDLNKQVANTDKFDIITGYKAEYDINDSIDFLLEHCREKVKYER